MTTINISKKSRLHTFSFEKKDRKRWSKTLKVVEKRNSMVNNISKSMVRRFVIDVFVAIQATKIQRSSSFYSPESKKEKIPQNSVKLFCSLHHLGWSIYLIS